MPRMLRKGNCRLQGADETFHIVNHPIVKTPGMAQFFRYSATGTPEPKREAALDGVELNRYLDCTNEARRIEVPSVDFPRRLP